MTKSRDLANAATALNAVDATELGFLDGVTSNIQTQLDAKAIPANVVNNSLVDAKGDLIVGTAADTVDRLAVGNSGDSIVADSAQSTGLAWAGNYAAGKNKILNGDFNINQRAFTSTTTNGAFGFDRFFLQASDGTTTWTAQTFTPGAAPVAGYEGTNYSRIVSTGQTLSSAQSRIRQNIEDVRTFAGQTITVSFWAKAATGTPNIVPSFAQVFGSGGSANVFAAGTKQAITTSWVRYSFTVSIPSVSGKTIGTSSYLSLSLYVSAGTDQNAVTDSLGIQSNTFDIWGVQAESGSVATAFQTATGTIQGETSACQRYYFRSGASGGVVTSAYNLHAIGYQESTTVAAIAFKLPITMRIAPTAIEYANVDIYDSSPRSISALTINSSYNNPNIPQLLATGTGMVQYRPCSLINWNNTGGYVALTAEL